MEGDQEWRSDDDEFADGVGDDLVHIEEDDDYSEEEDEDYDHYGDEINGSLERGITRDPGVGGSEVEASLPRVLSEMQSVPRVEAHVEDLELSAELLKVAVHGTQGNLAILANRCAYEGGWRGGIPDGYAALVWKDGVRYEGQMKDGRIEGEGTFYYPTGGRYQGEVQNGLHHGAGTFTLGEQSRRLGAYARCAESPCH